MRKSEISSPSGMSCEIADLELRRRCPAARPGRRGRPLSASAHRLLARDDAALEDVVRLDLLLHLLLDLREILRRDAVRQIDVVIKPILHRRPRGELRLRPDAQDGRRQHVGGGVAQALEVGHLVALFEGFAFVGHRERGAKLPPGAAFAQSRRTFRVHPPLPMRRSPYPCCKPRIGRDLRRNPADARSFLGCLFRRFRGVFRGLQALGLRAASLGGFGVILAFVVSHRRPPEGDLWPLPSGFVRTAEARVVAPGRKSLRRDEPGDKMDCGAVPMRAAIRRQNEQRLHHATTELTTSDPGLAINRVWTRLPV